MQTTEDSAIIRKTLELCQLIVDESEFKTLRNQIDAFEQDETAQTKLQALMEKGDELTKKQNMGTEMSGDEVTQFEAERTDLLTNPIAKGYLDAQETMHRVRTSVDQYVQKTFQLGRPPKSEDFNSEGCGSGCGCSH